MNTLMTRDEVMEQICKPMAERLKALVTEQFKDMKPGETRTFKNPFGGDLMPFSITKPLE